MVDLVVVEMKMDNVIVMMMMVNCRIVIEMRVEG